MATLPGPKNTPVAFCLLALVLFVVLMTLHSTTLTNTIVPVTAVIDNGFHSKRRALLIEAKKLQRTIVELEKTIDDLSRIMTHIDHEELLVDRAKRQSSRRYPNREKHPGKVVHFPLWRFEREEEGDALHGAAPSMNQDTIFVNVVSFRDRRCKESILDMIQKADDPKRIYFGIVEQHVPEDPSCLPHVAADCQLSDFCVSDHIRSRRINPSESLGATFAKYLGMMLYRGQRYVFVIDSNVYVLPKWDELLVRMHRELPSEKAILSHLPATDVPTTSGADRSQGITTHLCRANFMNTSGVVNLDAVVIPSPPRSIPQPWATTRFLFADGSLVREVPFDHHLVYDPDGEDELFSARAWTHGWDMYSPRLSVAFYKSGTDTRSAVLRDVSKPVWEPGRANALLRVQYLLHAMVRGTGKLLVEDDVAENNAILKDIQEFGLGSTRPLRDWYVFAGIDPRAHAFLKNWCL
jgi:UDP-GlcNAc:polypeptide alpha-N-acetylglucosaminyltransferase